jgi:glycosyltransferase involved in cell wall biosynthesis
MPTLSTPHSHADRGLRRQPTGPAEAPSATVTIVAHDVGGVGGMERVLAGLITGLADAGHRVVVIARTCVLPSGVDVEFHRVPAPRRPFVLAYPWFMVAASLAVRRRRQGIVQATGAIVLNRVDVVAVHYCHQVGPAAPSRATPLLRLHSALVSRLKRAGERLLYGRRAAHTTFVCVSEGVAREIRTHFPDNADRVVTIYNGIDVAAFSPGAGQQRARALRERLGVADGRLLAVFVGRAEWERKGLAYLIEALPAAGAWDVLVVGAGDRHRYSALADSLGVGSRVWWLGITEDMPTVYSLADAFVLPSAYETFSLVTFEAAASALPILASPVSGVSELIRDGQTGFVIDRDPGQIAERLQRLAADDGLRLALGDAARQAALAFDDARMVQAHIDLYARLSAPGADAAVSAPASSDPADG